MKKNRPAIKLSILCSRNKIIEVEDFIFKHLSTIGIRKHSVERTILTREVKTLNTNFGPCRVKIATHNDSQYFYPEYDDVKQISLEYDLSFHETYHQLKHEFINLHSNP